MHHTGKVKQSNELRTRKNENQTGPERERKSEKKLTDLAANKHSTHKQQTQHTQTPNELGLSRYSLARTGRGPKATRLRGKQNANNNATKTYRKSHRRRNTLQQAPPMQPKTLKNNVIVKTFHTSTSQETQFTIAAQCSKRHYRTQEKLSVLP